MTASDSKQVAKLRAKYRSPSSAGFLGDLYKVLHSVAQTASLGFLNKSGLVRSVLAAHKERFDLTR
jgi:hypothetical protein